MDHGLPVYVFANSNASSWRTFTLGPAGNFPFAQRSSRNARTKKNNNNTAAPSSRSKRREKEMKSKEEKEKDWWKILHFLFLANVWSKRFALIKDKEFLAPQEALGLFVLKTAGRPGSLRSRFLLCDPLAQLAAGGQRVGGEDDQATLGVVHVSGGLAAAVPTLRQWIPGYPRCAEAFLQGREKGVGKKVNI